MSEEFASTGSWGGAGKLAVAICLAVGLGACRQSPEAKLKRARAIVEKRGSLEKAEKKIHQVLEERPEDWSSRRLLVEVYRRQGRWQEADAQLERLTDLLEEPAGARPALPDAAAATRRREATKLYRAWAKALEGNAGGGAELAEVLRKGRYLGDEPEYFREALVAYHQRRARGLEEQGDQRGALEHWERVMEIEAADSEGFRRAERAARPLARKLFEPEGRRRLEAAGARWAEELEGVGRLDGAWAVDLSVEVDRRLSPEKPEERKQARREALVWVVDRLRALALRVSGLPESLDLNIIGGRRASDILLEGVDGAETTFEPGVYGIRWRRSDSQILESAFAIRWAVERRVDGRPAADAVGCPGGSWQHRYVLRNGRDGVDVYETREACRQKRRAFLEDRSRAVLQSACQCEL